jgi:hypothetical protein
MRSIAFALLVSVAAGLIGCGPPVEKRSYDVYVSNQLAEPVTVFITKDGPPVEDGWLSPEMLAAGPVNQDPKDSGRVVGPGFTAGAEKLTGQFEPATSAMLRVYRTTGALENFVALSPGNPRRVDVPLRPGRNEFIVTDKDGQLTVSEK